MNMCAFISYLLEEYSIDLEKGDIDLSVCGIEEEIFVRFDGDKMKPGILQHNREHNKVQATRR